MSIFRIDRTGTLCLFHPLQRLFSHKRNGIPILMYHSISNNLQPSSHPYYQTTTSPDVFAQHMHYLHVNGYRVITVSEAAKMLCQAIEHFSLRNQNLLERFVVITFDDGFRDFYTEASPVLARYNFNSTVFLPTSCITDEGRRSFSGNKCLSWSEVRELKQEGHSFGSHTVTHPQLFGISRDAVEYEIRYSKQMIEDKIGEAIELFSYPYAFPEEHLAFIEFLSEVLPENGYKNGVTTRLGTAKFGDACLFLKRIPMNTYDDLRLFEAKLTGAYDWLYWPQHVYKKMKKRIEPLLVHEV